MKIFCACSCIIVLTAYVMIKHKVIVYLIDREKEHGLTYYIALSQVIKFSNLGIKDTEGISKNKIKIKNQKLYLFAYLVHGF